jgi:hypothetical protein
VPDAPVLRPAVWLIGPSGVGKSTVGYEAFRRLCRSGRTSAYIDHDQIGLCYPQPPDDPNNHRIKSTNLGVVWGTYREAGATSLIMCGGAERAELVPLYVAKVPDTMVRVVRLRAAPAVLRERIFRRGMGAGPMLPGTKQGVSADALERMAAESAEEARRFDEDDYADTCIDTEDRSVDELADLVLAQLPCPPPPPCSVRAQLCGLMCGSAAETRRQRRKTWSAGGRCRRRGSDVSVDLR